MAYPGAYGGRSPERLAARASSKKGCLKKSGVGLASCRASHARTCPGGICHVILRGSGLHSPIRPVRAARALRRTRPTIRRISWPIAARSPSPRSGPEHHQHHGVISSTALLVLRPAATCCYRRRGLRVANGYFLSGPAAAVPPAADATDVRKITRSRPRTGGIDDHRVHRIQFELAAYLQQNRYHGPPARP